MEYSEHDFKNIPSATASGENLYKLPLTPKRKNICKESPYLCNKTLQDYCYQIFNDDCRSCKDIAKVLGATHGVEDPNFDNLVILIKQYGLKLVILLGKHLNR